LKKTVILGMGNPILTDDRIGLLIARNLEKKITHNGVDIKETNAAGFAFIELLAGYDRVIIIDSIKTGKKPAGTIYIFSLEDFFTTPRLVSIHEIDLNTALELGKRMGIKMPEDVFLIAVEIIDSETFSETLTPDVEKAIPEVEDLVFRLLEKNTRQV